MNRVENPERDVKWMGHTGVNDASTGSGREAPGTAQSGRRPPPSPAPRRTLSLVSGPHSHGPLGVRLSTGSSQTRLCGHLCTCPGCVLHVFCVFLCMFYMCFCMYSTCFSVCALCMPCMFLCSHVLHMFVCSVHILHVFYTFLHVFCVHVLRVSACVPARVLHVFCACSACVLHATDS